MRSGVSDCRRCHRVLVLTRETRTDWLPDLKLMAVLDDVSVLVHDDLVHSRSGRGGVVDGLNSRVGRVSRLLAGGDELVEEECAGEADDVHDLVHLRSGAAVQGKRKLVLERSD